MSGASRLPIRRIDVTDVDRTSGSQLLLHYGQAYARPAPPAWSIVRWLDRRATADSSLLVANRRFRIAQWPNPRDSGHDATAVPGSDSFQLLALLASVLATGRVVVLASRHECLQADGR